MLSIYMNKVDFNEVISIYYKEKTNKNININLLSYYYNIVKDKDFTESDLNIWLNNNFIIKNKRKKNKEIKNNNNNKNYIKNLIREKYSFHFKKKINEDSLNYYFNILENKDYSIEDFQKFLDSEFDKTNKLILSKKKKKKKKVKNIVVTENIPNEILVKKIQKRKKIKKINHTDKNDKIFLLLSTCNNSVLCIKVIDQIIKQTFKNWKLLIIDDNSDNEESQIIIQQLKSFNNDKIEYIKNNSTNGLINNINIGINKFLESGYNYFTYLDEDNIYYDNFLQELFNVRSDFTYSYWIENDDISEKKYQKFEDLLLWYGLKVKMWSKLAIEKIGYYNTNLNDLQDYDFLFRTYLILKDYEIKCCEKVLMKSSKIKIILSLDKKKIIREYTKYLKKFYNFIYNNKIDVRQIKIEKSYCERLDYNFKSKILKIPEEYYFITN